jgi:hypothetical protein
VVASPILVSSVIVTRRGRDCIIAGKIASFPSGFHEGMTMEAARKDASDVSDVNENEGQGTSAAASARSTEPKVQNSGPPAPLLPNPVLNPR